MPSTAGNYRQWLRPAFALLILTLVYFYRLDQQLLWDDEAETGVVARNVLHHGYPIAYDGRNVTFYDNGGGLNKNLVFKNIPWLQYYLGALSLLIFGNNTLGLRILFVFCGVLCFFPIYAVLKSRLKYPAILTVLTLISPQVVLFQRSARYYPVLILLYAVLVWHLQRDFKGSRNHFLSAVLIFVLLFHTHSFAAVCSALALVVFCLCFRREVLASYFFACAIGFASWLAWHQLLGPSLPASSLPISFIATQFRLWLDRVWAGPSKTILVMDAVGCLPILLWAALLAFLLLRSRDSLRNLFKERLYAFVFLNILIQTAAGSAVFGYSYLRYGPHLLVFGLVCLFMVLNTVIANGSLCLFVSIFAVAFNFLTLSFWAKSPYIPVPVPASWLWPVYSEIARPREDAWDLVVTRLESESQNAPDHDTVIMSLPPWIDEIEIFYLGDHYLIRPLLHKPVEDGMQALHHVINEQAFNRLFGKPEWVLDFPNTLMSDYPGYELVAVIPSHQKTPVDGNRPELDDILNCHAFPESAVVSNVRLFRLRKK